MVNRVQSLRSSTPGARPTGRSPGEIFTNFPDNALGVINAAGTAVDLVAVRFFSTLASYAIGDYVLNAGIMYRAIAASAPGAFVPAKWSKVTALEDTAAYLPLAGGTMTGPLVVPLGSAAATSLNFGTPGTGFFSLAPTSLSVSVGGVARLLVTAGVVQAGLPVAAVDGVVGAPGYTFAPETASGFYRAGAGDVRLSVGGADAVKWLASDKSETHFGPIVLPAGSAAATTLNFGTAGTGIYSAAPASRIDFAVAGTLKLSFLAAGLYPLVPYYAPDGTAALPAVSWASEGNTGFYRAAASDIRFSIGGADKFNFGAAAHTSAVPINVPVTPTANAHAASKQYVDSLLPAGVVVPYAAVTPPAGWLVCNGQLVSTTTYSRLFTAIGTTYGSGSGTFGVPDLRARVPVGLDPGNASTRMTGPVAGGVGGGAATLNNAGGQEAHVPTVAETASHAHATNAAGNILSSAAGVNNRQISGSASLAVDTIAPNGSSTQFNVTQPSLILQYIISTGGQ